MDYTKSLLDNTIKVLKKLSMSAVIKYTKEAAKYESLDIVKSFDYYYLAYTEQDKFTSHASYSEEALIASGINDPKQILLCLQDKNNIPENLRNNVLIEERKVILRDYVEMNDYYRSLIGLPGINDKLYFYVPEDICISVGITPSNRPIHEYNEIEIVKLETKGYLQQLISENHNKPYLKYLGNNKIDLIRARKANNFTILKITKEETYSTLYSEFLSSYEQVRDYFVNAIYIREYSSMYEYYDRAIAYMIMTNTIKRVLVSLFKNGIDRDFYDLQSIKMMYDAYNLPFIKELSLEQHRLLLRNINNLLKLKSTNNVIYELSDLLGIPEISVYKYYLVKEHRKDRNGCPIFVTTTNPETGAVEPNVDIMYDVKFVKVDLKEDNVSMAITKRGNQVSYNSVTAADPYWWDDSDTINAIYDNEFNFIETKYISFNIMYKMSKMIFETVYFLSILHNNRIELKELTMDFPRILEDKEIPLFDICIFIYILGAKQVGLGDNVITDPTSIGNILGFNFKADFPSIIHDIMIDEDLDNGLVDFIKNLNVNSAQEINNLYRNIRSFKYFVEEKMRKCTNIRTYFKYKKVYETIMTSQYTSEAFMLQDGTVAHTFTDLLKDINIELANVLNESTHDDISQMLGHIYNKLQSKFYELSYLKSSSTLQTSSISALIKLIYFFKSYTVDVQQFSIQYIFDDRLDNTIKLFDGYSQITTIYPSDYLEPYDTISSDSRIFNKEYINLYDGLDETASLWLKEDYEKTLISDSKNTVVFNQKAFIGNLESSYIFLDDEKSKSLYINSHQHFIDKIHNMKDSIKGTISTINYKDQTLFFSNKGEQFKTHSNVRIKDKTNLDDGRSIIKCKYKYIDRLALNDLLVNKKGFFSMRLADIIKLNDVVKYHNKITLYDKDHIFDIYDYFKPFNILLKTENDKIEIKDSLKIVK